MAPIDGTIGMKLKICNAYTSDVNISKAQPSKASGLGWVALQRSKSAPILYKYRKRTINNERFWGLVQIFEKIANDSPFSGKNSERGLSFLVIF